MQRARLSLRYFREDRREAVRQYVGKHWSEHSTVEKVPLNLLSLYVNVVGRNLIAKNPRVSLSTWDKKQKPVVSIAEAWSNQQIQRINLASTLQRVVLDGLFSIGICKVGLATPSDAAQRSWNLSAGEPFAVPVDLDDFVFDIHARDWSEVSYIGHRYRVPLDTVRDSRLYTSARKELTASEDPLYNAEGDERIHVLGRGIYTSNSEEFEDFVDLWEVYLPRHRMILTLSDASVNTAVVGGGGGDDKALREQGWIGRDTGPYHILPFMTVPGNCMSKGPVQDLIDLHEDTNNIYRKLIRQAQRQKEVLCVAGGAMEDGSRTQNANDGDIVRQDDPSQSVVKTFGSPNPGNAQFGVHLKDMFDFMAGNLALMGGLAPQAKTLGQDRMLQENASGQVQSMQETAVNFASEVCKSLLWYWWHDPFKTMKVSHSLAGLPEYTILRQVTSQQRLDTRFEELEIQIDPYSMRHQSPQERLQALNMVVQQTILPMMQLLMQQGIAFDMNAYLLKVAKYLDMPDLTDIVTIQEPPQQSSQMGSQQQGAKPPSTTRNYVRQSMGGDTMGNRDQGMKNFFSGNAGVNGTQQGAR